MELNFQVNRELMDVIESLKQKSKENQEPAEELSDEQINGSDENADLDSGDGETGKKNENADPEGDSQNSQPDFETERSSKRRKVDTAQVTNDENDSPSSILQVQSSEGDI